MPYKMLWYDAPHDENLPVHKELPEGVDEKGIKSLFTSRAREAWGTTPEGFKRFHHCPKCDGWIEGDYYEAQVNTLDSAHLAGRQGTEYYCRRCGYQVDFFGTMS